LEAVAEAGGGEGERAMKILLILLRDAKQLEARNEHVIIYRFHSS
jgi:hypothetical protein